MLVAGGVLTWAAGIGLELALGGDIATSLQFRFFIGVALSFAVGGGAHLKDKPAGIVPNHGAWLAIFALPGVIFAAPIYLIPSDWAGLSFVAVTWGVLAGGCGHLLSRMFVQRSG